MAARSWQRGACKVKLLKGKVTYQQAIDTTLKPDEILLCSAVSTAESDNHIARLEIKF